MSGFKDDVLAILKDNVMLNSEALGLITETVFHPGAKELYAELRERNLPVTNGITKSVFLFDYIVVPSLDYNGDLSELLEALCNLSRNGLLIIEGSFLKDRYISYFGEFHGNKVKTESGEYMVIRAGVHNGN